MADRDTYTIPYRRQMVSPGAITVAGTGLTTIATIMVNGRTWLGFHFATATQAIDDLQVYARAHPDAQYTDHTPTSATWATIGTPSPRMKLAMVHTTSTGAYVDADLNTVATTENGYFEMDVTGLYDVLVKASAAADSASVTSYYTLV